MMAKTYFFCCGQFWATGKCRRCGNGGTAPQREGAKKAKHAPIPADVSPAKRLGPARNDGLICESTFNPAKNQEVQP